MFPTAGAIDPGAVSRILSPARAGPVICLGDQPGIAARRRASGRAAPAIPYLILLRAGFALRSASRHPHGGLLHRRFTLTGARREPRPAVWFLWHFPFPSFAKGIPHRHQRGRPALRSPDFPPAPPPKRHASDRRPKLRLSKNYPMFSHTRVQRARYSMRPHWLHKVSVSALRASTICARVSFRWHPPQVSPSTSAIAASRRFAIIRS